MPSYSYRRVWGILRQQRRAEGLPPVNAKLLYRIIREHNLLLLHDKPEFARELKLALCTTAVSSPQSNSVAERFVKTRKEGYIAFIPKTDVRTALQNLAAAFTHYNENQPHSTLGYRSPREYRRQRAL